MNAMTAMHDVWVGRARETSVLVVPERRQRRLFQASRVAIVILDAVSGRIVEVNPSLLALTGASYRELLGRKLGQIEAFRGDPAAREVFGALEEEGYVRCDDLALRTGDGRALAVELVSALFRADGRTLYLPRETPPIG